jgi:glycosyltransferase involved in cell wall biosynthesis
LKAVPVVRKQAPDVEFVLVGGVEVGAEREKVEQAQAEALAAGGVTFPGIVTGQPKATLFAESDVFILPSYNENFPIAVLEAMAAGLPLVVTPVGALPEVLEEGRNCFFVEPGDCEALADRIVRLAHDPELRYLMGSANLSLYLEKFAPEVMLGKIEDLYNSLLKNHR